MSSDILIYATAFDATVRCMAAITTDLVDNACMRHATTPTASAALGRTLTGTLLLGSLLKDLEKITVQFQCKGPIGNVTAEADAHGNVRGYVKNPQVELLVNEQGKLDVKGVIGSGMLHVIRDAGFEIGLGRDPYCGSVPIVSGEVGEDLAYYLAYSEQIPSAVSLGVFVDSKCQVTAAGGFIIQLMPGADKKLVEKIHKAIESAPSITTMIRDGLEPESILKTAVAGIDLEVLDRRSIKFQCRCSHERALSLIAALGQEEVANMLEQDKGAVLTCHFCSTVYQVGAGELEEILVGFGR
ncbi:MAG: Hsp33 family molecular chaperone HslO [Blastocatellia bacterium]|nr:Hsp33 family molecular chaperone HslO [Blastocatellia bacterium]